MAIFKGKAPKPSPTNSAVGNVSDKTELEKDGEKQFEKQAAPSGFGNFFVCLLFTGLHSRVLDEVVAPSIP